MSVLASLRLGEPFPSLANGDKRFGYMMLDCLLSYAKTEGDLFIAEIVEAMHHERVQRPARQTRERPLNRTNFFVRNASHRFAFSPDDGPSHCERGQAAHAVRLQPPASWLVRKYERRQDRDSAIGCTAK
jgi:hypothetical protein